MTLIQFIITHLLLLGSAVLTRSLAGPLKNLGLSAAVAPAGTGAIGQIAQGYKTVGKLTLWRWLRESSGGIAGGGLFELEGRVARQVLPLAVTYVAKVILSNLSFTYVKHGTAR
jgi:hypothetical protein